MPRRRIRPNNVILHRPSPFRDAAWAARETMRGQLPPRYTAYGRSWRADFMDLVKPALCTGATVLDVGAGRRPVLLPSERPAGLKYIGLDVLQSELDAAPVASYDEAIAADVSEHLQRLDKQFDLIVSWQVFEHLPSVPAALDNFYEYLKPGGLAVISLSGRYSLFGLINMLLPRRVGVRIVSHVMRRDPSTVFPAYYDHCYRSALDRLVQHWSATHIVSAWAGAMYLRTVKPLQSAYVFYEEWAAATRHEDLATHYFMQLRK